MSSAALSYLKIPQTRAESLSLLECYAECSFILFKDIAEAESSNSAKIHQARGKAK